MDPLTINQIREIKKEAEEKISQIIKEFEEKTGVTVNGLGMNVFQHTAFGQGSIRNISVIINAQI